LQGYWKMVSIVILTKNSKRFLKPCLDSVFSREYKDFEIIVVDNGSEDDTVELIRRDYPNVILRENKENLGASRARNQGIDIAKYEWILTLDNDVVLKKGFLSRIQGLIKSLPKDIGIVQPKILYPDKKKIYSCGLYLSWMRRFYDIGKGKKDAGQYNKAKEIFGACSAAALYRRDMLDDIKENTGYFDERFFFLVEDVDLAWRAQRKSWKTLFLPGLLCYHSGDSSSTNSKMRQYLCFRNRYLMIEKNEGWKNYTLRIFPLLFYDFPRWIYLFLSNPYRRRGINLKNRS